MYIRDMSIGDQIEGFFLLQDAYAKTTLAGKPFLSMVLSDCTGTIDAQIWDYTGPVTPKVPVLSRKSEEPYLNSRERCRLRWIVYALLMLSTNLVSAI